MLFSEYVHVKCSLLPTTSFGYNDEKTWTYVLLMVLLRPVILFANVCGVNYATVLDRGRFYTSLPKQPTGVKGGGEQ